MNWAAVIWLTLLVVFLLVEASTVSAVSIWFAAGSLAAMIASLFHAPVWLQMLLFGIVSTGTLMLLRPLTRKYFTPRLVKTNADALIGKTCRVTEPIHNTDAQGSITVNGMPWSARSTTGDPIPQGTLVKIDRIEGVKVFVTPVQESVNV